MAKDYKQRSSMRFFSASRWLFLHPASPTESASPPDSHSPWLAYATSTRPLPLCIRQQSQASHQPKSQGRAKRETDPECPIRLILCLKQNKAKGNMSRFWSDTGVRVKHPYPQTVLMIFMLTCVCHSFIFFIHSYH